ncbi:uncharacterized protein B0H18DRAFT_17579 [Fomitopsis serialis]|uniref:uncharacterized protein n=1 Tax=Fomitopsis serialis TaxID=139415 RepID=UPI00200773F9|nr:uncharacterized protein B0H18DRAFT_17579 [Neoantrodia serialis]KAH9938507.1 hypothetical protein B0H18DRAFT_17579 [Neoantrodia serialis]
MSGVASAIRRLLPKQLPSSLSSRPGNLYEVLSRYPQDGVGQIVHQTRWTAKGLAECHWEVSRTKLKLEGTHGRAWGYLTWRGKRVSEQDEKIPGGLKYRWAPGASSGPAGQPSAPKSTA